MTAIDILALGEPLIEMVRLPKNDQPASIGQRLYRSGIGGDALNALVAAARQGARTGLISSVGDDLFGHDILEFCAAEGIDTHGVSVDPAHPTGLVYIDPDPADRRFFYSRKGSAASHLGPGNISEEMVAASRVLHVTGVTLAISETMRAAAFHAARVARAQGVLVSFDINFRPRLWSVEEALPTIEEFLPLVDIVLPSEDEAGALIGLASAGDILSHFGDHGARIVILKRGSEGAVMLAGDETITIPAVPVRAVDSSGAGDSFAGAFLAHFLESGDPRNAGHRAAQVAAQTVTGWGATEAIPRRADIGGDTG
ncbi:sugar kinase [Marimonas sp. MJW-29]|uniref:Sugar kinase n=1 Tax=Sulfitobacter sediminis TaxID=3234186 RepID=A0ABV3RL74_9RHOB